MLEDFLSYIQSNLSVIREDKILLSVSGGVDSMVMLHLFRELGFNIAVAHINHSTRNGVSDKDMEFVESICNEQSVPFYSTTLDYKVLNKGNFQENARNERFLFLAQLQKEYGFKWIATAHHKTDRWETFLMHLNRKSGIQGLTSLRLEENHIIHPLLVFTKDEILNYALVNNIKYVHDKSNDSNDYLRNSIRNQITPVVTQIFPTFIENVNQSIHYLSTDYALLQELINKSGIISYEKHSSHLIIDLVKVRSFAQQSNLLFHIIEEYGFNFADSSDILQATTTGAIFQSSSHEALRDRGRLIIRLKKDFSKTALSIQTVGNYDLPTGKKIIVNVNQPDNVSPSLWLDIEKVNWPLTIRNIEPGDKFQPDGLKGATKSIKKLCTDLKISRFAKDELLLVCQGELILQIIGIKTSHNYNTTDIKNALTFNIVE